MPPSKKSEIGDRIRIQHMLEAAQSVQRFVTNRQREDLDSDEMFARAVLHALLQIGEAAANVSDEARSRAAELPWGQIVAMRHVMVHVYWGVDLNRVWNTATADVPVMIEALSRATQGWPLPSLSE